MLDIKPKTGDLNTAIVSVVRHPVLGLGVEHS